MINVEEFRSLPAATRARVAASKAVGQAQRERDDTCAALDAVLKLCNAAENLGYDSVPVWRIRQTITFKLAAMAARR